MKKIWLITSFIIITSALFLITVTPVGAQLLKPSKVNEYNENINRMAGQTGYSTADTLEGMLGTVIRILLGMLGIVFVFLMFIAGQNWMRAGGNEEKITKAKNQIQSLVIGLIIVLGAYAISSWLAGVFASLVN